MMCQSTESLTRETAPIGFSTYTICNGRNGGLEPTLRGMSQANMGLGILQETKITDNIFTCRSAEYSIVALDKPSQYRGGLLVFHQLAQNFSVEAIQKFGPNAVGFHLVTGGAAVVHHGMLPHPQQHLNNIECRRRAQGSTKWR